ncbi:acyltransferase family protein [Pikeienuella sp. HZG-20]|uniref:acyltransferase family protein n=1 Tax=Paludibacillus litoralis TaxID=3133267 RepID=UPI0030EF43F3
MPELSGSARGRDGGGAGTRRARNGDIDRLRFVGALGIVWFHIGAPGASVGHAALLMFMMLLVYFSAGRPLAERAHRLLMPWLIWSVIYGALKVADAIVSGHPLSSEFDWWMLATGPSLHLWFLPFSFAFVVLSRVLESSAAQMVAVVVGIVALWAADAVKLPPPLAEWVFVAPAALTGLAMRWWPPSIVLGIVVAATMILASLGPNSMVAWKLCFAALIVLVALRGAREGTPRSAWLGSLSLGIYLVHPAIAAMAMRVGLENRPFYLVVVGGTVAVAILIRRHAPWLA